MENLQHQALRFSENPPKPAPGAHRARSRPDRALHEIDLPLDQVDDFLERHVAGRLGQADASTLAPDGANVPVPGQKLNDFGYVIPRGAEDPGDIAGVQARVTRGELDERRQGDVQ